MDYVGKSIGLQMLTFFPLLTDPAGGEATYGEPIKIGRAITATTTPESAEGMLESEDGIEDQMKLLSAIGISFNASQLTNEVRSKILGHVYDSKGGLVEGSLDTPPWGAFAFRTLLSNEGGAVPKYGYVVLYKGRFSDFPENYATKRKDSIEFQTHTVEGNFVPRESDHLIKYSIREDDPKFDATQAAAWFTSVQEPVIAVSP